ncbi:MAG: protein kinase [Planctomycetes bacterium]|nr:protein kinase [Planctomycetota bacterium]
MAACDTLEELLQAHLDGELSPEEAATVDAHLPGCAGCREVVDELQVLGERLGELFVGREQEAAPVAVPGVPAPGAAAAPRPSTQRVFGGYRLEQEIARGGMGTVHRAVQLSMDRPVALKVLAPRLAEDEEFVARFLREAKVAATLSHPNLVTIYDVGREGQTLFYSMELVDGEDAEAAMKRHGGRLPPRQAVAAALGAARALEAARQAGIVHRDVKPANILLTPDGGVKLTDLGLAKATDAAAQGRDVGSLTLDRKIIGSPNYMSPEQAGDIRAATHRSDVYSLGATLLHLLTGQVPFAGGSPVEVIARVLRDPPALPERLPGGEPLDDALRATLARALEKAPEARHATAGELAAELARWLEGGAATTDAPATRATPARPTARTSTRGRRTSSDGALRARAGSDAALPGARGTARHSARLGRGSDTGRLARPGRPAFVGAAIAAALLAALALTLLRKPPADEAPPVAVPGTEAPARPAQGPEQAPRPRRVQPGEAPTPAPRQAPPSELEVALAALEADLRASPPPADADVYRRARDLALRLGDAPAGERALALRDEAGERLQGRWGERAGRARELEADGRWFAATELYREHLLETGEDAPTALDAQLALRSLEAQALVRLEGDLARLDELLGRGELVAAAALVAQLDAYAGPVAARRGQARVDEAAALAARGPATPTPAPTPAPGADPAPKAEDEAALALAARERRGREALARVRALLDKGDVEAARAALEGAREAAGDVEALKDELAAVVAAVERAPAPLDDAGLLACAFGAKVTVLSDGRAQLVYDFEADAQAADWTPAPAPRDMGNRMVQRFIDGQQAQAPRGVGEPWSVVKKTLVGYGWTRRSFAAGLRTDAPLVIEVEARGRQNTLVGLQGAGERTVIVGLGYMLEELPLAGIGRGNEEVQKFVGRLSRTIEQSRRRGPSAVIVREARLMELDELQVQAHAPRDKAEFTVEVTPVDRAHEVSLRVGRRVVGQVVLEDLGDRARVNLLTLGAAVAYDRIVVTGALDPAVLERLRALSREVRHDPEALRRRVREERERAAEREQERGPQRGGGGERGGGERGGD